MVDPHAMSERTQNSCVGMPRRFASSLRTHHSHHSFLCTHDNVSELHGCLKYIGLASFVLLGNETRSRTIKGRLSKHEGEGLRGMIWNGIQDESGVHLKRVADTALVAYL